MLLKANYVLGKSIYLPCSQGEVKHQEQHLASLGDFTKFSEWHKSERLDKPGQRRPGRPCRVGWRCSRPFPIPLAGQIPRQGWIARLPCLRLKANQYQIEPLFLLIIFYVKVHLTSVQCVWSPAWSRLSFTVTREAHLLGDNIIGLPRSWVGTDQKQHERKR